MVSVDRASPSQSQSLFDQQEFDIRCEWGLNGVRQLAPISDAIIIVDVLSFSTAVDIAIGNDALVYPYRWNDETAMTFARSHDAILARGRDESRTDYTLAPSSLLHIPPQTRLVLPSPNGSTLSLATGDTPTLAGCIRNAKTVANAAATSGQRIGIIPAGERWKSDGTLRPALEDLIGAGAIICHLAGNKSPEAQLAEAAYLHFKENMTEYLKRSSSGRELIDRGFEKDVELAGALNISNHTPQLINGAYINHSKM